MAHAQQLFVGRLPIGTRSEDLDKIFRRYGRMTRCDVKQGIIYNIRSRDYSTMIKLFYDNSFLLLGLKMGK